MILTDRLPIRFQSSQQLDAVGKKIWPLLDSGVYRLTSFQPKDHIILSPAVPLQFKKPHPTLHFFSITDPLTRTLAFKREKGDVLFDSLPIEKTEWIRSQQSTKEMITAEGLTFSVLGFNLNHPFLKDLKTRQAIAQILPSADIAKFKWKGWATAFTDFKITPEPDFDACDYLRKHAPLQPLTYLSTTAREGLDTALILQQAFKKCGLQVNIQLLDSSIFYARLKKGLFTFFSTRIFRIEKQDPLADYIQSTGSKNYFFYANPKLDQFIQNQNRSDWQSIKPWIQTDLPFVPLYSWNHALILSKRVKCLSDIHLDETFRFLLDLALECPSCDAP